MERAENYRDGAEIVREEDKGVEDIRQETRMSLKDYLRTLDDRSERKDIESAVNEAANVLRKVWGRTINIKDLYLETFADKDQLGAATPGDKAAGISLSTTLMHPFCRAQFIETLVHEGHHMLGNLDGEEGETIVRMLTSQYSNMVQSSGFEDEIKAMKEVANLFEKGDLQKGLKEMAEMYTEEPTNLYFVFLRKYCKEKGISPFAFWYYRTNPFNTGDAFSPKDEKGEKIIPKTLEEAHQIFCRAFPELANALTVGDDGGIKFENASFGSSGEQDVNDNTAPADNDFIPGVEQSPLAA